jgi:hypothetical protein
MVRTDPLRWYAIAVHREWETVARLAARYSLAIPLHKRPQIPENKQINATALHLLHEYHWKCGDAIQDVLSRTRQIDSDDHAYRWVSWLGDDLDDSSPALWSSKGCACSNTWVYTTLSEPPTSTSGGAVHNWVLDFIDQAAKDLVTIPGADVGVVCMAGLNKLAKSATNCKLSRIGDNIVSDVSKFLKRFNKAIDSTISEVLFPLFCYMLWGTYAASPGTARIGIYSRFI